MSLHIYNVLLFLHLTWKRPSLLRSRRPSELSDHHKTLAWALPSGWALWFSGVFDLLCSHLGVGGGPTVWAGNLSKLGDGALSVVNDTPYPSMYLQTIVPFTAHTFLFSSTSESPPRFHLRFRRTTRRPTFPEHAAVWNAHKGGLHMGDWFQVPVYARSLITRRDSQTNVRRCASPKQATLFIKHRLHPQEFFKCTAG